MAAYAALVSLSKVIDLILSQEQKYVHLCSKEQMMSLHEEIGRLQELLEDLSGRSHSSIDALEGRIRDVAYRLEDVIEYDISGSLCEKYSSLLSIFSSTFDSCTREIGILLEEAVVMKEKDASGVACHPTTTSSSEAPTAKLDINEVPVEIMDWIFGSGSMLEIVPITGMGGIGKTTLARAVYEHPKTQRHFDICSWVTVSQEFNVKDILRALLPSEQQSVPDVRLIEFVHKRLMGRRFLIVLDDMWDAKAWNGVKNALHDDNKGSRIILTTRLQDVASCVGSSNRVHQMQFMNDEQSWDLLREKVGGNMHWPKKLEDLGRIISRNCRGLPLAVVAMAGLLKFNTTEEYWERVARDAKSNATADYDHLLNILALSYTNLPPHLKGCFLYFGLFKEDSEIPTEKVVRLWTAEGFLKARGSKEMEEVAEEYLEELVARSLVLVKKKRRDGRIITFSIHDVLRDLSIRKAREEKFYHHITKSSSGMDGYSTNDLRRATIDRGCFTEELAYCTHVRSVQYSEYKDVISITRHFRLLRVLATVHIAKSVQLRFLYDLTNLRYLEILLSSGILQCRLLIVGESISNLQNLETLIFCLPWSTQPSAYSLILPSGIWKMPRLRHLILVEGSILPCPTLNEISCSGLQTLTKVTHLDLSRSMIAKLSNLKKLKLHYSFAYLSEDQIPIQLNNLVHLYRLEELSILSSVVTAVTDLTFPHKLKKLSLKETQMPMEKMSLIGSLPNLEVLKLKDHAVEGKVWEPAEGEFLQLKYLRMQWLWLEEWIAESEHFPQLETLIIRNCHRLKEVPAGIGEIDTLQKLVLEDCKDAEESVEEIKAEQESLCNLLQVVIIRAS